LDLKIFLGRERSLSLRYDFYKVPEGNLEVRSAFTFFSGYSLNKGKIFEEWQRWFDVETRVKLY
jgi:hypothetical protein